MARCFSAIGWWLRTPSGTSLWRPRRGRRARRLRVASVVVDEEDVAQRPMHDVEPHAGRPLLRFGVEPQQRIQETSSSRSCATFPSWKTTGNATSLFAQVIRSCGNYAHRCARPSFIPVAVPPHDVRSNGRSPEFLLLFLSSSVAFVYSVAKTAASGR